MTDSNPTGGPLEIVIVCDDTRHARGKVAHIETFTRQATDLRSWYATRAFSSFSSNGIRSAMASSPHEDYLMGAGSRERQVQYRCKLCGLDLQCNVDKLYPILNALAQRGVSQTTLRALIRVISKST